MNRSLLLLFSLLFVTLQIQAQQTYLSRHYGGPGTIYLYNRMAGASGIDLSIKGENVDWDLTSNTDLNTIPNEIVRPSEAIDQFNFLTICSLGGLSFAQCFNVWNNTDQAVFTEDSLSLLGFSLSNIQRYHEKTNAFLKENFFGFTVDFGGTPTAAVLVYQNPDTVLRFPLEYTDHWSSSIQWGVDLSATGMNLQYLSNQTRTAEVDAWGTIYTPYDTFSNVIRLRAEILHQDTIVTDSFSAPVQLTQLEYMWFDTTYKLPVMLAQGLVNDSTEVITFIQYIYEATCPPHQWTLETDQDIYYLDSTGQVTVHFIINNGGADEYTWDFGDGTIDFTTDTTSHTYITTGEHSAAVSGCMTDCLPLNSCSFGIVDFEIIDTNSTSVVIVPGDVLGIKLFPNPAQEAIALMIPHELTTYQFEIIDLLGRIVERGNASPGLHRISTGQFSEGVYTLRLHRTHQGADEIAMVRFTVAH